MTIDVATPATWPVRMKRAEVAAALRRSLRTLFNLIERGRFPKPDGDGMWCRDVVRDYAEGGIKQFDRMASRGMRKRATVTRISTAA